MYRSRFGRFTTNTSRELLSEQGTVQLTGLLSQRAILTSATAPQLNENTEVAWPFPLLEANSPNSGRNKAPNTPDHVIALHLSQRTVLDVVATTVDKVSDHDTKSQIDTHNVSLLPTNPLPCFRHDLFSDQLPSTTVPHLQDCFVARVTTSHRGDSSSFNDVVLAPVICRVVSVGWSLNFFVLRPHKIGL